MRRKLNLYKTKTSTNTKKVFVPYLFYAFLALFFTIYMIQLRYLNIEATDKINRHHCLNDFNDEYSGIVLKIGLVNRSKLELVEMTNGLIKYPFGLHYALHRVSPGDSIIKRSGSFDYIVFPARNPLDSFILHKHEKIHCNEVN